jgi:hypothetical protein
MEEHYTNIVIICNSFLNRENIIPSDVNDNNEKTKYGIGQLPDLRRVLRKGGRIAVNIQPVFSDFMATHHEIYNQLKETGFLYRQSFLGKKVIIPVEASSGALPCHPVLTRTLLMNISWCLTR